MSFTLGIGEPIGSYVSWGFGYALIVIIPQPSIGLAPPVPVRPRLIRVPFERTLELASLNLIKKWEENIQIASLSILELEKIAIKMSELNLLVPAELSVLLEKLKLIDKESKEISFEELNLLSKHVEIYTIEKLNLIKRFEEQVHLESLSLIEDFLLELRSVPEDLYKVKLNELTEKLLKYYELLELLEELGKD